MSTQFKGYARRLQVNKNHGKRIRKHEFDAVVGQQNAVIGALMYRVYTPFYRRWYDGLKGWFKARRVRAGKASQAGK